jgi:hypothetical protein
MNAIREVRSDTTSRRFGHFVVGAFAALCAAFIPRLAATLPTDADSTMLTIRVFTAEYVLTTLVFALLVGGVVVVFEWTANRSPREVFMSALPVPALITGFVNAAAVANQARQLAGEKVRLSMERANEAGIEVEPTFLGSGARAPRLPSLIPTAFAASRSPVHQTDDVKLGIQLRESKFWVSLGSAPTMEEAEARRAEIGPDYGELKVEKHGEKFHVVVGDRSLPYSEAVSRAIEIKRKSDGDLRPALIGSSESGALE